MEWIIESVNWKHFQTFCEKGVNDMNDIITVKMSVKSITTRNNAYKCKYREDPSLSMHEGYDLHLHLYVYIW